MMKKLKRTLSILLIFCMLFSLVPAAGAQSGSGIVMEQVERPSDGADLRQSREKTDKDAGKDSDFADTDKVRVSIVLEEPSVLEQGYPAGSLAESAEALACAESLLRAQDQAADSISRAIGTELDVQWNLTLAANVISANVLYGQLDAIRKVKGVKRVLIEPLYTVPDTETDEPQQYLATGMTGTAAAWTAGLTGAGSRVAILDTGLNDQHQSFSGEAWRYAMEQNAKAAGVSYDEYLADVDVLDQEELTALLPKLHVAQLMPELTADVLYLSDKVPFSFNYADQGGCTDHSDGVTEHGSHVAGIAAANRYIPDGDGFAEAISEVKAVGQAPDAQIINMRVFSAAGSASASDYLVAIEDALFLGCDVVNMSLGTANPGYTRYYEEYYDGIWQSVLKTDLVLSISMGNNFAWADFAGANGYNYLDTPTMYTGGSPGSRAEALTVASVNNMADMQLCFKLGDTSYTYYEYLPSGTPNAPFATLDSRGDGTEYEYLYFPDRAGVDGDFEGLDLTGKIVFLQQTAANVPESGMTFASVHERLAALGASAYVMCNAASDKNYMMDLSGSGAAIPGISISRSAADMILSASTELDGGIYGGRLTVFGKATAVGLSSGGEMSRFSSWGVPGDLSLKPEITAPGGYIYSVNGTAGQTTGYESMSGTSMAAPQIAGMTALLAQFIRENGLLERTGLTQRQLAHSLLMGTATPLTDKETGLPISMLKQGAGLANISDAIASGAYILVDGQPDGKVKAELGEDADRDGVYSLRFTLNNLTDQEISYFLNAKTYTQDAFTQETDGQMADYQSYKLRELEAIYSVRINGSAAELPEKIYGLDFDGDGDVDLADGQALLDYTTGARETISNASRADLNGDGRVTSFDAHLFLSMLSSQSVTVPANGSVTVDLTIALGDGQKAALDARYPAGAYIQTYLRLEAQANAQGAVTSDLGIPVFAYYGSWTDAGMFDVGTRSSRSTYDTENGDQRKPYLMDWNYVMLTRAGRSYDEFSGNPYVVDDAYIPDRFAITFQDGTYFDGFSFTLIRNAVDSRVRIYNPDTGDAYFHASTGNIDGAYFNVSSGSWFVDTDEIYFKPFRGKDANGNALPEGTRVRLEFQAAPEYPDYYTVDGEGNFQVDWDKLGSGSTLGVTFTIDNTAPVATSISRELLAGEKLHVTVQDNRYVAAAFLLSKDGKLVYSRQAINQTEPGVESTVTFDYSQLPGDSFMICVADYAGNENYYNVTIEGRPAHQYTEKFRGYQSGRGFIAFDTDVNRNEVRASESVSATSHRMVTYADGLVIAANNNGRMDIYYEEDNFSKVRTLADQGGVSTMLDLYFDPVSESLYTRIMRVGRDSSHAAYYAKVDMETGEKTYKYLSFSCGDENLIRVTGIAYAGGDLYYCIDNYNKIYSFRGLNSGNNELTLLVDPTPGNTSMNNIQAFCYGKGEKCLWWVNPVTRALTRIDVQTGKTETYGTLTICPTDLWIDDYDAASDPAPHWYDLVDRLDSFTLSASKVDLMIGETKELTYTFKPWNTANSELTWTSDNESAVTVKDGVITGAAEGTATVTATSQLDPTKTATVTVTVSPIAVDTFGVLQNPNGEISLFRWNFAEADAPVTGKPVAGEALKSAARTKDGKLYLNLGKTVYGLNPETGELIAPAEEGKYAYSDMAASVTFANTMYGIADFSGLYLFDPDTNAIRSSFNLTTLVGSQGATRLIGVAYGGYYEYEDEENEAYYDGETLFLLDNLGCLYKVNLWEQDGKRYAQAESAWKVANLAIQPRHIEDVDNSSLVYNAGTGSLTLSTYNGGVSEVYLLRNTANAWSAFLLGATADEIRPMALFSAGFQAEAPQDLPAAEPVNTEILAESLMAEPDSVTNPGISYALDAQAGTVTVTVRASETLTNGKLTLEYDHAALTLRSVEGGATLNSRNGDVLAFANRLALQPEDQIFRAVFSYASGPAVTKLLLHFSDLNEAHTQAERSLLIDLPYTEENCPSSIYTDRIPDWAHEAIDFVTARGYMIGMGDHCFGAYETVTRGQAVTVLYRMAGSPAADGQLPFADVQKGQYFYNAVLWGYQSGIVKGITQTEFAPGEPLTRAQMVTLMYRFAAYMGAETGAGTSLDGFADAETVPPYAREAMAWAVESGVVIGDESGQLDPNSCANRAQLAVVLARLCKQVLER